MFKKTKYFLAATALLGLALSGCGSKTDGDVTNPNPNAFQPKGTVSGVLTDAVTQDPIANATVYIMDRSATTGAQGQFTIANVPANTAVGNEPTNAGASAYTLVIDMTAVNSAITAYNADTTHTTKKAFYPGIAYSSATVSYTSLGDATGPNNSGAATTTSDGGTVSNHDTPVDGFVANITPSVGKLDANIKIQVVKESDLSPVSGATVTLSDNGVASNNNATGNGGTTSLSLVGTYTGHLVATQTSDANGFVTFTNVEAKKGFTASGISSDSTLSATLPVTAPVDGETRSYLVQGGGSDGAIATALKLSATDGTAPFVVSTTPANLADIAAGTTNVVFTFSEVLKANNYLLATTEAASQNAGSGLWKDVNVSFLGPKAGNMAYTMAWDSTTSPKVLTITLTTAAASKYSVSIDGACGAGKLMDAAGNLVAALGVGVTPNTVTFTTSGGNTVVAPTLTRTNDTTIDWVPVTNAYKYRVYVTPVRGGVPEVTEAASDITDTRFVLSAGTSAYYAANGFASGQIPVTYSVKVITMGTASVETAGASSTVTLNDTTKPKLAAPFAGSLAGLAAGNQAIVGAANTATDYTVSVTFNEAMSRASIQDKTKWTPSRAVAASTGGEYVTSVGVASVAISGNGTGACVAPTVSFSAPQIAGGVNATGTVTVAAGVVTGVTITTPGKGYTSAPTVTFTLGGCGTLPTGTATVTSSTDIDPVIKSVDYNTSTTATVTLTITNNAAGNGTWDPRHILFTSANTDVNGNAMDATADAYDVAGIVAQ